MVGLLLRDPAGRSRNNREVWQPDRTGDEIHGCDRALEKEEMSKEDIGYLIFNIVIVVLIVLAIYATRWVG